MTKRTAKFVSAIAASFLASAHLTTPSHSAAAECLAGPKDQTPQGSHWYYHIDHTTKRHCWYLGDERETSSQGAASISSPAKSVLQKSESALPRAVADAHAELPAASNIGRPHQGTSENLSLVTPVDVKSPAADPQPSIIASRWPDQALPSASGTSSLNKPGSSADVGARAGVTPKTQLTSVQSVEQLATADLSSQSQSYQTQGYSLQILLAAMAGTLALAGIITSLFLKFSNSGAIVRSNDREWSGRQTGFARDAYPARDRASEFFAQISRRHPM